MMVFYAVLSLYNHILVGQGESDLMNSLTLFEGFINEM
jgi:hypothetical protein